MEQFVILDSTIFDLNDPEHRPFKGSTFDEFHLREWASRVFEIEKEASFPEIATAIKSGGWALFQHIPPT